MSARELTVGALGAGADWWRGSGSRINREGGRGDGRMEKGDEGGIL